VEAAPDLGRARSSSSSDFDTVSRMEDQKALACVLPNWMDALRGRADRDPGHADARFGIPLEDAVPIDVVDGVLHIACRAGVEKDVIQHKAKLLHDINYLSGAELKSVEAHGTDVATFLLARRANVGGGSQPAD